MASNACWSSGSSQHAAISVADENVSSRHLKRTIGEVASAPEIVEQLLETAVVPGDAIFARDGPRDLRRKESQESRARAARVELVLRLVQSVEKVDGSVALHC
jgi:hypothetical protein